MSQIKHRFDLEDIVSTSRYSNVYKAFDQKKSRYCTVKLFQASNDESLEHYKREVEIYKKAFDEGDKGFPRFLANGTHQKSSDERQRKFLVISRHGYDLQIVHKMCGNRFSYKTSLQVGIQVLERLQFLHHKGYVYNDLNLSNILIPLMSNVDQQTMTLTDFGECEKLSNQSAQKAIKDLERLLFLVAYMIKGELPWKLKTGVDVFNKDARVKTKESEISKFLYTLDIQFSRIYKNLKAWESLPELKTFHYESIYDLLSQSLQYHLQDTNYRYDWFPVLAKIQKHNRKQGLPCKQQSFSYNTNQERQDSLKRKSSHQRQFTLKIESIDNKAIPIKKNSQEYKTEKKLSFQDSFISGQISQTAKDEEFLEDESMKKRIEIEKEDEYWAQAKVEEDKYNFLKLLHGSNDISDLGQGHQSDCSQIFHESKNLLTQLAKDYHNKSSTCVISGSAQGFSSGNLEFERLDSHKVPGVNMLEQIVENLQSEQSENGNCNQTSNRKSSMIKSTISNPIVEQNNYEADNSHRRNQSLIYQEMSAATIEMNHNCEFDEGNITRNEVKTINNQKENPLQKQKSMFVQSRTFILDYSNE